MVFFARSDHTGYSKGNLCRKLPWPDSRQVRCVDTVIGVLKHRVAVSTIATECPEVSDQGFI